MFSAPEIIAGMDPRPTNVEFCKVRIARKGRSRCLLNHNLQEKKYIKLCDLRVLRGFLSLKTAGVTRR